MKQFILLIILLIIPVSCKSNEEKNQDTIQMVMNLKEFHQDLLSQLEKEIYPLKNYQEEYQYLIDLYIQDYIKCSTSIYLSLCDIYEENYRDEEICEMIDPILNQIMNIQCGVLKDYASVMVCSELLSYTGQELERLHQVGDIMEVDTIKKVWEISRNI